MIYQRTNYRPLFLPWNRTFVVVIYRPYRTFVRRRSFTIEHLFDSLVKNFRRRYITECRFFTNYAEHLFSDNSSLPNICAMIYHLVINYLVTYHLVTYHLVIFHLVIYLSRVKQSHFFPAIVPIYIHIYNSTYIQTPYIHIYLYISIYIYRASAVHI